MQSRLETAEIRLKAAQRDLAKLPELENTVARYQAELDQWRLVFKVRATNPQHCSCVELLGSAHLAARCGTFLLPRNG